MEITGNDKRYLERVETVTLVILDVQDCTVAGKEVEDVTPVTIEISG